MRIDNKARFILAVISGEVKISNRKKADIERDLDAMGFDRLGSKKKVGRPVPARSAAACTCAPNFWPSAAHVSTSQGMLLQRLGLP
jgi:hypothetical protein